MKKKLTLDVAALAVASFDTEGGRGSEVGTVHGRDANPTPPEYFDCTCAATCDCPTAYYWCGDGYYTLYSCKYTHNESCAISAACSAACTTS
jgi:hypothetical protein